MPVSFPTEQQRNRRGRFAGELGISVALLVYPAYNQAGFRLPAGVEIRACRIRAPDLPQSPASAASFLL